VNVRAESSRQGDQSLHLRPDNLGKPALLQRACKVVPGSCVLGTGPNSASAVLAAFSTAS
jgi:hypothetical protein